MGVTSTNLGRVGLLPKGEYNAETSYVRLDIVTYEGSAYVALQDVSGVTPGTDPANWQLLAARGEIGPQGNEGQRGEQGERGNGIVSVTFNPEDYTLTIQTDDGDDYTSPSLRGEKGETGEPGKDGDTGPQGEQGEQGE